jgi:hypothetical protein
MYGTEGLLDAATLRVRGIMEPGGQTLGVLSWKEPTNSEVVQILSLKFQR